MWLWPLARLSLACDTDSVDSVHWPSTVRLLATGTHETKGPTPEHMATRLRQQQQPDALVKDAEAALHTAQRAAEAERLPWWSVRRRGQRVWAVHLGLLALFGVIAFVAHRTRADGLDVAITDAVQQLTPLDGLLRATSWLGYAPQQVIVFGALIVCIALLGFRAQAVVLLLSSVGSALLNEVVKQLVNRPRPSASVVRVLRHVGGPSFPSGHVMSYIAFFGLLAYLIWIGVRRGWVRRVLLAPCVALLILVGPSRVYLGAHWASDVIGAYLLGGIWLSIVLRLYVAWLDRRQVGDGSAT